MKITTLKVFAKRKIADCLIVPFFEDQLPLPACDIKEIGKYINMPIKVKDFKAKKDESIICYASGSIEKRILLLGLGKSSKISAEDIRKSFSVGIKRCQKLNLKSINILFPKKCKLKNILSAILEGVCLSNYFFHKLKKLTLKDLGVSLIETIQIIGIEDNKLVNKFIKIASAVNLAKDLTSNNADDETPQHLAKVAKELTKISSKVKVKIFDKKMIEKEGMGLLLAVNKGSFRDPAFIVIEYTGNKKSKDRTALIGKGITYDSGGICLKPYGGRSGIQTMKFDMSGAASIIGVMHAIVHLDLNKNVTALIPATENSIGSKSYKPGDVYSSHSKKTVEVLNTDAEGRLVLADAISYAVDKVKPSRIIDIASLTGAIAIALGDEIAGLFSNDKKLVQRLMQSSEKTGELLWEMPLYSEYKKMLKSDIADIKNLGDRNGGSITAALFLESFVKNIPWAHIDIGGTCGRKPNGYNTTLATGYGVRLILDLIDNL